MASVVVHASCYGALSVQSTFLHHAATYRLLELLQELVCLLLLRSVAPRLHHVVRRQHRLEALHPICSHVRSGLGTWWGEPEAEGARRWRRRGMVYVACMNPRRVRVKGALGGGGCVGQVPSSEFVWG
jgi:hypothetical protein